MRHQKQLLCWHSECEGQRSVVTRTKPTSMSIEAILTGRQQRICCGNSDFGSDCEERDVTK